MKYLGMVVAAAAGLLFTLLLLVSAIEWWAWVF